MTEEELKLKILVMSKEMHRLERDLYSGSFGWTSRPPPTSGIIETDGFIGFDDTINNPVTHLPGLIDAAVYRIPVGTLWRHDPRKVK